MKLLFNLIKLLTGALFVFSGLVKLNDPAGFSIKLDEYFDVFSEDVAPRQDSIQLQILAESHVFYDSKFLLYPSDKTKEVKLAIASDTNGNYQLDLKWGGMERTASFQSVISFPEKIGLRFIPLGENDNKALIGPSTRFFELDSIEIVQKNARIGYNVRFNHAR